jgi:L-lactate dehydrogenase complex protein LldE
MATTPESRTNAVALYVTCLADMFRPGVGMAAVELLERAGYQVDVPGRQTCCGQPAWNSGDDEQARELARQAIGQLEGYRYVVVPSGSCAGTMVSHYPALLAGDRDWQDAAYDLANRTWELTRFLVEVARISSEHLGSYSGTVTYHDSCSGLRQLNVREQPRQLLAGVDGLTLKEMDDTDTCCGFGGTFWSRRISANTSSSCAASIRATSSPPPSTSTARIGRRISAHAHRPAGTACSTSGATSWPRRAPSCASASSPPMSASPGRTS